MNWRKSSYSKANGNCLEAGQDGAVIVIRDTKAAGTVLELTQAAWAEFMARIREGS